MAASSGQRTNGPSKMLAFALLLIGQLLSGVMAQDGVRGDGIVKTTANPGTEPSGQVQVFPTLETSKPSPQTPKPEGNSPSDTPTIVPLEKTKNNMSQTEPSAVNSDTPAPNSARGDNLTPVKVICVTKEVVEEKNAVLVKLKSSTKCGDTKTKITQVLHELCGEECKLEIYQEDDTDHVLVSGKNVEDDVIGMVNKFNNDSIKGKVSELFF
uniref:CD34 molecule n=1 Tax=Poecilia reticulata TaxID=8081 RepID=A0A3P9PE04_POERE